MKPILGLVTALAMLSAAFGAQAHEYQLGDLKIIHPHAGATGDKSLSSAGYFQVINQGSTPDRLLSVTTDAAMAMIHKSEVDANGVATMQMMEAVDIPAGASVALEPGGLHVMFTDITAPFAEGSAVKARLTFEQAGSIEVDFKIDAAGAKAGHQEHSAHQHGDHGAARPDTTGMSDPDAIAAVMKAQFDKPDAPLTVLPIIVKGAAAVAGWSQGGMGGRAFLRKGAEGWTIALCSGASLKQATTLEALGIASADAHAMAAEIAAAEAALTPEQVAEFDAFEGTVMIEGN